MVEVFSTLCGPNWESHSKHEILDKHVTKVGLFYSFYVSKVKDPISSVKFYSVTKHTIKCKHCSWSVSFGRSSGGRTGSSKKRDPTMYGPGIFSSYLQTILTVLVGVNHCMLRRAFTSYITNHLLMLFWRILLWPDLKLAHTGKVLLIFLKCHPSTFSRAKRRILVSQAKEKWQILLRIKSKIWNQRQD